MLSVRVSREFFVVGATNLDEHTDAVIEELLTLEDESLSDSDVTVELANSRVTVSVSAHAATFDEAVARGDVAIRTAIHASGGHTPEWENTHFEVLRSEAELLTSTP